MILVPSEYLLGTMLVLLKLPKKCTQRWNVISSAGSICTAGNYRCRSSEEDSEVTSKFLGKK